MIIRKKFTPLLCGSLALLLALTSSPAQAEGATDDEKLAALKAQQANLVKKLNPPHWWWSKSSQSDVDAVTAQIKDLEARIAAKAIIDQERHAIVENIELAEQYADNQQAKGFWSGRALVDFFVAGEGFANAASTQLQLMPQENLEVQDLQARLKSVQERLSVLVAEAKQSPEAAVAAAAAGNPVAEEAPPQEKPRDLYAGFYGTGY